MIMTSIKSRIIIAVVIVSGVYLGYRMQEAKSDAAFSTWVESAATSACGASAAKSTLSSRASAASMARPSASYAAAQAA